MSRRAPIASSPRATSKASTKAPTKAHRPATRASEADSPRARSSKYPRRTTRVLLSIGVVVTVLALGAQWTLHSSLLRVRHVTLVGNVHESTGQVLAATGLNGHPSMLGVSSEALTRDLTAFAWVKGVRLVKHWPNSVTVTVSEVRPVGVAYDAQGHLRFVSAQGRDLGGAPLNANYPTLVYQTPLHATWPFLRAGQSAAQVASKLPPAFSSQVDEITVDDHGQVTLRMTTPVSFVLGEATQLHQKFVAIASVIAHSTLRSGDVIDVSVPDELAVSGPAPS